MQVEIKLGSYMNVRLKAQFQEQCIHNLESMVLQKLWWNEVGQVLEFSKTVW